MTCSKSQTTTFYSLSRLVISMRLSDSFFFNICILNTNLHCSWIFFFFFTQDNRIEGIISVKSDTKHTLRWRIEKSLSKKKLVICTFAIKFKLGKGKLLWKSHRFPPEQSWEWNVISNRTILSYNWCEEWNLIALTLSSVSRNKVHYTPSRNSTHQWKSSKTRTQFYKEKNVCCSSWSDLQTKKTYLVCLMTIFVPWQKIRRIFHLISNDIKNCIEGEIERLASYDFMLEKLFKSGSFYKSSLKLLEKIKI